jgi:hypothetical protein
METLSIDDPSCDRSQKRLPVGVAPQAPSSVLSLPASGAGDNAHTYSAATAAPAASFTDLERLVLAIGVRDGNGSGFSLAFARVWRFATGSRVVTRLGSERLEALRRFASLSSRRHAHALALVRAEAELVRTGYRPCEVKSVLATLNPAR